MPRIGTNQRAVLVALYPDKRLNLFGIAEQHPDYRGRHMGTRHGDPEIEATVSAVLKRWLAANIVERHSEPGRARYYVLTEAGRKLAEECGIGGED